LFFKSVLSLGQLDGSLSPPRPRFDSRPIHMGFVVDEVAVGRVFR